MPSPLNLTSLGSGSGISTTDGTMNNYKVVDGKAVRSLFTGGGQFSPYPAQTNPKTGDVTAMNNAAYAHSGLINDISTTSIIEYLKNYTAMKLEYADFAYLKHIGVFPNNRLIIARRFASGVGNDLTSVGSAPIAALISWVDLSSDSNDIISIKYYENWVDGETNFESLLNDVGTDLKGSPDQKGMERLGSDNFAAAFNILPFPGFMEGVMAQVMNEMGLSDHGIGNSPYGNPNIIAESRRRKTQDFVNGGSGLTAKFSVKMVVEYEQKFINGVDPTLAYFDIIQNALSFGTSDANFRFNQAFADGATGILKDLISGDVAAVFSAVIKFVTSITNAILKIAGDLADKFLNPGKDEEENKLDQGIILNALSEAIKVTFGHVISKYKLRIIAIASALTGAPSTPWHITIGNPKKPIFSSGDMEVTDCTLSLGKILAFNDLPSSIKLEITFTSARNLGAQEIFNRFNTGKGRSYVRGRPSFVEHPDPKFPEPPKPDSSEQAKKEVKPDTNTGTSASATSVNNPEAEKNRNLLAAEPLQFNGKKDDYKLADGAQGQDWLNYTGPILSSRVDNTDPNLENDGNKNLSGQSNGSSTTNNVNGVNVPITGSASPTGTTGLGPVGASPSVPPPPTADQIKSEKAKLEAELARINTLISNSSDTITDVYLYTGDNLLAKITTDKKKYEDTDEYKRLKPFVTSVRTEQNANPAYEQLIKKKAEIETKIKNLPAT